MTGKTSLATLVSLALVNRHKEEKNKAAIFNLSALAVADNQTFENGFEQECKVSWENARVTLPAQGYKVYMVLDETQVIYKEGTSSPRHKSTVFWKLVKYVLNNAAYSMRILMFAAYGSDIKYTRLTTPIQFVERMVFGIKELNFSHDEVQEYVSKWFEGIAFLESSSTTKAFCANLEELTVEECLRKGILVQTEQRYLFSSPVIWRFFVKMRVGNIVRARYVPKTLPEMIARVMQAIDFSSIRRTLGRSLSSDIPLERIKYADSHLPRIAPSDPIIYAN
ncbi:hypothetical protein BBJ29_010054 [Phytophthora kernoviae]|uniref:Uncharacterized protein n=1 Tax=Phytophthora kernoviae TaxID=325452 RepID=A0A421FUZ6_9STRA|nr:hypothetical protein BBJ29_010054 [Phytophthora kernoviae]